MRWYKRKWRDREGSSGRWPGYVMSTKVIFSPAEVSFSWQKSVFRDVRMQYCVALRFLVTPGPSLHETFGFLSNIRPRLACMRTSRKTASARTKTFARLKITFVDMTYPKGWTRSLPLCPLMFSWMIAINVTNYTCPRGTARLPTPKCIGNERISRLKCIVDQNITRQQLIIRDPGATSRARWAPCTPWQMQDVF